jgi:hypothetical protein
VAAARRCDRGTVTGAVTLGAIVDGDLGLTVVAGAVVVAGAGGDDGEAVAALVAGVVVTAVLGSVGASVTAGLGGGVVAVAWVEIAARPANTPTPASPPAAIQRVAMAVRAMPRSRSSSG